MLVGDLTDADIFTYIPLNRKKPPSYHSFYPSSRKKHITQKW
jgi:hypothetical protein